MPETFADDLSKEAQLARSPGKENRFDRFWRRVDASGDCWEWTGFKRRDGYGQFARNIAAHREAWEQLVGPIPVGLELDHLCRNPSCVNPDHLEPVTREENLARGAPGGRRFVTQCRNGHLMEGANVYWLPDRSKRQCRSCVREWKRRKWEADRAG